jgi:DegV family protein with EDD domain
MSRIHVVTDSCARFTNAHYAAHNPVTIVPNTLTINGKSYREGSDISTEDALKLISKHPIAPKIVSPSVDDYIAIYGRLIRRHDAIISVHPSREIFPSWINAKAAAQQMMGQCKIFVIDSQMLCAAQGMLVQVAVKALQEGESPEEIIRLVRGAVDRVYAIYYVDTTDFLRQNDIMSASHAVLGRMLGIKPFIAMEDGNLTMIEKVRTRNQAIDRLVEFSSEFVDLESIALLQPRLRFNDQTRILQDKLAVVFPGHHFPYTVYSSALAALIGTHATGVVVLECETGTIAGNNGRESDG